MMTRTLAFFVCAVWLTALPVGAQHPHHPPAPPAAPPPAQKPAPSPAPPQKPQEDHSHHHPADKPALDAPREPIPPVTDADRAAAFPQDLEGHTVHDSGIHHFVLFEQLEWRAGDDGGLAIENTSWIGGDINRAWFRLDTDSEGSDIEHASLDALWGHSFSRWWDVVVGVRQDFRPGDPQTWAAVGIQGLAPQWFEVQATGYVSPGGRTQLRLEAEYDLLLTNRLILQPVGEVILHGRGDPERGVGAGLSALGGGLRVRYEIRRELAPYIGVTWERKLFGTADLARGAGDEVSSARLALGLRAWF